MTVYPLIFEPIFRPKIWGGRKLSDVVGKSLPPTEMFGESWEVADLPSGASVVANGALRGRTLHDLLAAWGNDLTGRAELADGRFPLVIKFLDAREPLSIQVHPGPSAAARADGVRGIKHEAWHVLAADPGAVIYLGLRRGITPAQVEAAAGTKDIVGLMNAVPVKVGQTLYCPGGTLHALGAGVVVAEVQTTSDITYRLYDWERTRPAADAGMHVAESLAAIEWGAAVSPQPRSHVGGLFTTVTRLVSCDAFQIEKVRMIEQMELEIPYAELVIWIMLEGSGVVTCSHAEPLAFKRGDVIVLPAALKAGRVKAETACAWLEVTIPRGM